MLVDIAKAGIVRPLKSGRQGAAAAGSGLVVAWVGSAYCEPKSASKGDRIQVAKEIAVDTLVELISHLEHRAKTDVLLHAECSRCGFLREGRPSAPHIVMPGGLINPPALARFPMAP